MGEEIDRTQAGSSDALAATQATPSSSPTRAVDAGPVAGARIRQYELIRELGRGGMGRVFLARDTKLGRRVAMKFLVSESAELTERLLAEARATARCNHENIVVIHEADEHEGQPYIVLEYLEGTTLRQQMTGKRIHAGRAVELLLPVVRALQRAHEFNIVHRDLKPENIFLTSSGTIKVLDFGLAKTSATATATAAAGGDAAALPTSESFSGDLDSTQTHQSALVGTLPYMAPEQLRQEELDPRTDLWAVGVMLHEMLAGKHPLAPVSAQTLIASASRLDEPMPRVGLDAPDVPEALERVVERCLAKRKAERVASARELAEQLEPLLPRRYGRLLRDEESPFPGLTAFQEADADRFFGRAADINRVVTQLGSQPMVAVVGPSGVGKSSFLRAGVLPALKASGEGWEALVLRPGRNPLSGLGSLLLPLVNSGSGKGLLPPCLSSATSGLEGRTEEHDTLVARLRAEPGYLGAVLRRRAAQKDCQILLFVDQLEELYTLVPDAGERAAFTACLSGMADDAAAPLRLLVSMRSDLLDRVAEDADFLAGLTHGLFFLQPLGREGLREALVHPIEMCGYRYESAEMVTEMIAALSSTAGAPPLLQFAAARLWAHRDRQTRTLTRAAYAMMGGISGALATHADEVVAALAPTAQRLARVLFQHLVTPEGTRAIVDARELAHLSPREGEVDALVERLVAARLLQVESRGEAEGPAVELVHESLIASWPTLRRWLDEDREDAAFLAQLRTASRQWEQKGRPQGLLWRGEAMQEARLWRMRYRGDLPPREQAFLKAVFALAGRASLYRQIAALGTITLLAALLVVGFFAMRSVRRAEREAVAAAERAQRETDRARQAEQKVMEQMSVIRAEQSEKQAARVEVERGKEDLRAANDRLEAALVRASKEESRRAGDAATRAQDAATRSQELARSLQEANARQQRLLAEERARAEKLEKERKKITTTLK